MTDPQEFYTQDYDVAQNFARLSLARMKQDNIPAVPQNFEVWYVYYANIMPELTADINTALEAESILCADYIRSVYEKYLNFGREHETYQRAGNQINATLGDVTGLMQDVKETTFQFTDNLSNATDKLEDAEVSEDVKGVLGFISDETKKMMEYNAELESRLDKSSALMDELRADMERIRQESVTDGLTGIANRKALDSRLDRTISEADEGDHVFSLIMMDIDHFKDFNDKYGHQVGDQVLRLVAMTLVNEVKGQDMVARYGGEEFAVILPMTQKNVAHTVAENLRRAVENKEVINRKTGENLGQITISLGVAEYNGADDNKDALISRADAALYAAKDAGRNCIKLAD